MHFFLNNIVSFVLKPSCIIYTLGFSALASCVALPRSLFQTRLYRLHPCNRPASMQSSARYFLVLKKKSLFLEVLL